MEENFENLIKFSKYIIEFFKNDYICIKDFLISDSPWDKTIEWEISNYYSELIELNVNDECENKILSHVELIQKKQNLISAIFSIYYKTFVIPKKEESEDDYIKTSSLDKYLISSIQKTIENKISLFELFQNNSFFAIQILKYYIDFLNNDYGEEINICTYNQYKYDINSIINLRKIASRESDINFVSEIKALNGDEEEKEKIENFFDSIVSKTKNYISNCFRKNEDAENFINYLFSLVYAYIKKMKQKGEEMAEIELYIEKVIESDIDLLNLFYTDEMIASYIIENIYDNYEEYGDNYDLRYQIKDTYSVECMEKLDEHYNDEKLEDIMIHDYSVDARLSIVLLHLYSNYSYDDIYAILINNDSLYDILYQVELDARNSEYYKFEMIKKIIAEVYEYISYINKVNSEQEDIDYYKLIKDLKIDKASIIGFFSDNYMYLLEKYEEYATRNGNIHEKAWFNSLREKEIKKIEKLSFYSLGRYLRIIVGRLKEYKSVDYVNDILENIIKEGRLVIDNELISNENKVKMILLNVYERLITSQYKESKEMREIIECIECTDDYSTFGYNNMEIFLNILLLFIRLNLPCITYLDESNIRNEIKDKEKMKIIKKLNIFNE